MTVLANDLATRHQQKCSSRCRDLAAEATLSPASRPSCPWVWLPLRANATASSDAGRPGHRVRIRHTSHQQLQREWLNESTIATRGPSALKFTLEPARALAAQLNV